MTMLFDDEEDILSATRMIKDTYAVAHPELFGGNS